MPIDVKPGPEGEDPVINLPPDTTSTTETSSETTGTSEGGSGGGQVSFSAGGAN
ncbi:hypothetical protein ONS95_002754 [Cadophora gregata]|uniref:uncharacterized protein n=1 Tax=Cadophora gregata TaxID=51156 RepID=UPI0026DCBD43|nr:uncharacterized protein ONS95_002754 [Cadophora gregata]KAK0110098.1 hypothetical protein ONS95_002754 [Cadophora gregata]KAK0110283.1 hypothetical protein ONS96_001902 [Cadophora gregata f. sp. sojae]